MAIRSLSLALILVVASSLRVCDVVASSGTGRDDTAVIQKLFDDPTCGEIVIQPGHSFSVSVLWVKRSDVVLTISANATLNGLPDVFKLARPDCNGTITSEFKWWNWCAMLRVESERNFTLQGSGTLAPGGVGGVSPDFYSALHVRATEGVQLSGVRIHCTAWWWCTALHNATDVYVSELFIDGKYGRDGMDLVNCRRVLIEDSRIEGSDDGLCIKSVSAHGLETYPAAHMVVRRTELFSTWDNAIQFGSATEVLKSFDDCGYVLRSAV
jgi:hypothetical protein